MLESGCIVECGTYDELKKREGVFCEFIRAHLNNLSQQTGIFLSILAINKFPRSYSP